MAMIILTNGASEVIIRDYAFIEFEVNKAHIFLQNGFEITAELDDTSEAILREAVENDKPIRVEVKGYDYSWPEVYVGHIEEGW